MSSSQRVIFAALVGGFIGLYAAWIIESVNVDKRITALEDAGKACEQRADKEKYRRELCVKTFGASER